MMKNPPAFPVVGHNIDEPWSGMTLRDYFAAAALQGIMASVFLKEDYSGDVWDTLNPDDADILAGAAYSAADAMLNRREKQ